MGQDDWAEIDEWHVLFDRFCNHLGHYDNARLGGDYCARMGKRGEAHFEAAVRNLRNWRSGKHIPRQRNFMILTQMLGVQEQPALLPRWNALYARARAADDETRSLNAEDRENPLSEAETEPEPPASPSAVATRNNSRRMDWKTAATGFTFFVCGIVAAEAYRMEPWHWFSSLSQPPLIVWRPHASMEVGESLIIHGDRGDCGKPPPNWEYVLTRLPVSRIGTFSDGGIVRRNSNFCRGETPARAVTFTATRPGIEEFLVLGDVMRVTVTEPSRDEAMN